MAAPLPVKFSILNFDESRVENKASWMYVVCYAETIDIWKYFENISLGARTSRIHRQ